MELADFDFTLPKDLIAQTPLPDRSASRLLVLQNQKLQEKIFTDLLSYVSSGDVLVLNDTKVIKSRLFVDKDDAKIELFLHKELANNLWQAFVKPAKKVMLGDIFNLGGSYLIIKEKLTTGECIIQIDLERNEHIFDLLNKWGHMPLPPYIKRDALSTDDDRYQTVFANLAGSVAAPTAGLHFTCDLLNQIKAKGVKICYITLHVGAGTFLPIKTDRIDQHKMHDESYSISRQVADTINAAKNANHKIISVGTTSLRALESSVSSGKVVATTGSTDIFITPGFDFKVVDMLVTNFHLPKSTLLMLVAAFAGLEPIKMAYDFAIANQFRFFSYGDANLLYKQ